MSFDIFHQAISSQLDRCIWIISPFPFSLYLLDWKPLIHNYRSPGMKVFSRSVRQFWTSESNVDTEIEIAHCRWLECRWTYSNAASLTPLGREWWMDSWSILVNMSLQSISSWSSAEFGLKKKSIW